MWSICPLLWMFPHIKGVNPETEEEEERPSSDDEPFSALAFKIATDPFVGKLCFFRVYSGTLNAGSYACTTPSKDNNERIGRILHDARQLTVRILRPCYAGDIAAAVGLKNTTTGDTLCDPKHPIILESMEFPEPVIRVAIEPKTKAGQEKMGIALAKLAEEDPTFRTYTDEETGQTIIAGMGELHLEIIVDRLLREFKVEANVGKPQVAYKETITQDGRRSITNTPVSPAVRASTAMLRSMWSPTSPARAMSSSTQIVGGAIPKEYIPAVDARYPGRHAGRRSGRLSGCGRQGHSVRRFLSRGRLL